MSDYWQGIRVFPEGAKTFGMGGFFFLGLLFFWVIFFLFAFPWVFLGKTPVSLRFGRIWRDFPWFSYEKT